jgi:hypothetical protein
MGKQEKLRFAEAVRGRGSCSRSNTRRQSETEHLQLVSGEQKLTEAMPSEAIKSMRRN